jgi:hypothetical protein
MDPNSCPIDFNFAPETFKVGDSVSYRVAGGGLDGVPFMGVLIEVHADYVVLTSNPEDAASRMKATRESRPVVAFEDVC